MPAGRPTQYSATVVLEICRRMAEGESLRGICRDEHMPPENTVRRWAQEDREGFSAQYARAREVQGHAVADRAFEEAFTADDPQLGRLRFDAARWFASKVLPKVYGDKLDTTNQQLDKNGQPMDPVVPRVVVTYSDG